MASVWKRLQRVNKRAAKFEYTASYHSVNLETSVKWKPNKLCVVWTRRSRRVVTDPREWEPTLKDPLKGSVVYPIPENKSVAVTLFKDSRTNELEDKDWTFVLEDVSHTGKRRRLASSAINMRKYASLESSSRFLIVNLEPTTQKIVAASVHLTLHCVLLREGQATDEDMQSLASLLSVNNNSDIAVLEDLDEDDYSMSDHSTRQMLDFRQQMEEMTHSLTNSDIAATPNSVQSLNFDNSRTPTAPISPSTPVPYDHDRTPVGEMPSSHSRPEYLNNLTKLAMKTEPSKFTSGLRNTSFAQEQKPVDAGLKSVVFKTKQLSKHNLKPLELKTNFNDISLDKNDNRHSKDSTPVEELTPVGDVDKSLSNRMERDKTPVQDLLEWCKDVTAEYKQCKVTNLTTSWRNGLAFCAVIHHFRPDLIDFSGLQPDDADQTLRVAFEASALLGISQVLTAADISAKPVPDRLAIMTHLFQLRAHFTGSELQVEQLGTNPSESSYLVGRHDTDGSLPRELFSREVSTRRSRNTYTPSKELNEYRLSQERAVSPEKSPSPPSNTQIRDFLTHSKQMLMALSPVRDKVDGDKQTMRWFTDPVAPGIIDTATPVTRPEKLMTRKELTDPFGSDDEEEQPASNNIKLELSKSPNPEPVTQTVKCPEKQSNSTPPVSPTDMPKPTPQLLSRHDELKERARQLLEATKREAREKERGKKQASREKEDDSAANDAVSNGGLTNGDISPKKMTEQERQAALRERARKLIADARAGIVSPTSPSRPQHGTVEIISRQSVLEEIAAAGGVEQLETMLSGQPSSQSPSSRRSSLSPDRSGEDVIEDDNSIHSTEDGQKKSLHSFSALVDRLTPNGTDKDDMLPEGGSYIASEMEALEREQSAIDEKAAALEKELRTVMESADNNEHMWRKLLLMCAKAPTPMEEDRLMSQWFNLVNKKNALLRRQMQLNILEQEEDLSRRCELLAQELRLSLAVEEWRKTPGQKRRERLLLQELVSAVNERDRLVQEMDEQEKAIADDDEIERNLSQVEIQRKNNCILQ